MTQILFNGAEVFTNGDNYNLSEDMVKLCLSLNIPIPVDNQTQRDGLAALSGAPLKVGTMVLRKDQSMLVEKWNGSTWKTSAHSEWTKTAQVVPVNTVWGVGALTQDATKSTDAAFISHPSGNVLKFRDAGTYVVTFSTKSNAILSTRAFIQFDNPAGTDAIRAPITGEDRGVVTIPNFRAAADDQLVFTAYHESGASRTMDFRIRVTRIA